MHKFIILFVALALSTEKKRDISPESLLIELGYSKKSPEFRAEMYAFENSGITSIEFTEVTQLYIISRRNSEINFYEFSIIYDSIEIHAASWLLIDSTYLLEKSPFNQKMVSLFKDDNYEELKKFDYEISCAYVFNGIKITMDENGKLIFSEAWWRDNFNNGLRE